MVWNFKTAGLYLAKNNSSVNTNILQERKLENNTGKINTKSNKNANERAFNFSI